jgi:hypothetical protein
VRQPDELWEARRGRPGDERRGRSAANTRTPASERRARPVASLVRPWAAREAAGELDPATGGARDRQRIQPAVGGARARRPTPALDWRARRREAHEARAVGLPGRAAREAGGMGVARRWLGARPPREGGRSPPGGARGGLAPERAQVLCAGEEEKPKIEKRFLEFSSSLPSEELLTSR